MITTLIKDIDFAAIREDFPILKQTNRGKPLVYLDSAASAQKPKMVLDAMSQFYSKDYASIHRGIYELSERSTVRFERVREEVRQFIQAEHADEIIFVRGTTEGINLVAQTFGRAQFKAGDEVLISEMEHHSNTVPWYLLKEQIGIELKVIPITDVGEIDIQAFEQLFTPRTKLVAVTHASNVLGTINPVKKLAAISHARGVPILLDGAQAIPHLPVNVKDIDCDFYTFSAHKLYGPTGIGVLYGKRAHLAAMPPYHGGGGMIETVSFNKVTFAPAPQKFEAGTPDVGGVTGLSAAINYLQALTMERVQAHEEKLLQYALKQLSIIPGLRLIGTSNAKVGVISFVLDDVHPHDIGTVLDHEGVAIRAGHHCAMPLMERFKVPATVRASFGIYTNENDIDALVAGIHLAKKVFT